MNKILTGALLLLFSSSAAAQTPRDSIAFATAQWRTADLGGGGSSTLWTAQEGVLNHPYDNRRFDHEGERGVPNCIVVRR